ncbi:hypothetical protein AGMMS50289_10020 [Betaproteobacteria bacterium]|nr:hypothetical protein AGMMS50289_10020 [Betaproteobacteria bacterium]
MTILLIFIAVVVVLVTSLVLFNYCGTILKSLLVIVNVFLLGAVIVFANSKGYGGYVTWGFYILVGIAGAAIAYSQAKNEEVKTATEKEGTAQEVDGEQQESVETPKKGGFPWAGIGMVWLIGSAVFWAYDSLLKNDEDGNGIILQDGIHPYSIEVFPRDGYAYKGEIFVRYGGSVHHRTTFTANFFYLGVKNGVWQVWSPDGEHDVLDGSGDFANGVAQCSNSCNEYESLSFKGLKGYKKGKLSGRGTKQGVFSKGSAFMRPDGTYPYSVYYLALRDAIDGKLKRTVFRINGEDYYMWFDKEKGRILTRVSR